MHFSFDYTVEVTNRLKGSDLIDRVLEEQWMEVPNIVQDVVIKIIPRRNAKRAKWLSERSYTYLKRRERKRQRVKERYITDAQFQRIAKER